jgi:hypothetical protein
MSTLMTWGTAPNGATLRPEAAAPRAPASVSWVRFGVLATPIVGVTLFSKFTIPPLGEQGIDVSLFLVLGAVAAGVAADCIRVDPARLTLYVMLIGILGLIQSLQPETFSIPSMLLLAGLHLPYVFAVPRGGEGDRIVQFFLGVVTLLALLGISQYALQFVVGSRFLFPIENFFPSSFIVQHYNAQAALSYGSEVYRPNGVFMLEPSFFSQVLAVAIVAELCTRARALRLVIFGAALIVSYSGTGVLVLAVCLPLYLAARRRWDLLILGCSALILVMALHNVLHLDRVFSRLGEFNSTQSSGFARFVGGFFLFDQFLWNDPWRTLFGYGAGAFSSYAPHARYPVAEMALFKIVFEYGLFGAVLYFGFLLGCLSASTAPRLLILAVAITYLLNGMYASFAHGMALGLLLWCPVEGRSPLRAAAGGTGPLPRRTFPAEA